MHIYISSLPVCNERVHVKNKSNKYMKIHINIIEFQINSKIFCSKHLEVENSIYLPKTITKCFVPELN
jgi:hypothetical protein